jgi:hypothetical protein
MKKLLPFILKKVGNKLPYESIQGDMITFQQIIVARACVTLQQIRKYQSPKEYATKVSQQLQYKKTIPALFVVYDYGNVDTSYLYTPGEIRRKIIDEINSDISIDSSDITASIGLADDGDYYLSSKDMNKAMQLLQKEIGVRNIKGKREVKKNAISGQKIELKGRPSVYKMPNIFAILNTVCSDRLATRQVIKTLLSLGMLDLMAFILEASFYTLKDSNTNRVDELFKVARRPLIDTEVEINADKFQLYKEYIKSLDEDELRLLAINKAKEMLNHPEFYGYILLSSLF